MPDCGFLHAPGRRQRGAQWNETAIKAIGRTDRATSGDAYRGDGAGGGPRRPERHNRRYAAYYFEGPGEPGASPDAAVAAAAHTVLVGVVASFGTPAQKVAALPWSRRRTPRRSPASPPGPPKTRGGGGPCGRCGHADAPQGRRRHSGCALYAGEGPGKWRPHPNPVPPNPPIANAELARGYVPSDLPGWGNVTPFTLLSASQFWLPGPPALTSEPMRATTTRSRASAARSARRARRSRQRSRASGSRAAARGTGSPEQWPARATSMPGTAPGSWAS